MEDKEEKTIGVAQTYQIEPEAEPRVIVVHCSDPRFQSAFDRFIEEELGLKKGEFVPFVVGGGAGVLAHPERLPKEFKFMKERFELFRQNYPSIKRIVLINHQDCAYYKTLKQRVLGAIGQHAHLLIQQPRDDMLLIGQIFNRFLSHLGYSLELYFAKFTDETCSQVVFERIGK